MSPRTIPAILLRCTYDIRPFLLHTYPGFCSSEYLLFTTLYGLLRMHFYFLNVLYPLCHNSAGRDRAQTGLFYIRNTAGRLVLEACHSFFIILFSSLGHILYILRFLGFQALETFLGGSEGKTQYGEMKLPRNWWS